MAKMGRPTNRLKHQMDEIINSPSGVAKFKRIMAATKREETFLAYFKEAADRSEGRAPQFLDVTNHDDQDRIPTETLVATIRANNETIAALRKQLEAAGIGVGMEASQ